VAGDGRVDAAFTRLDRLEEYATGTHFGVMWQRHTGQRCRRFSRVTLDEALRLFETEGMMEPDT
jgi:hypothetical protein